MIPDTFYLIICVFVGIYGICLCFRCLKEEKEHEKRYKELLEKEKLLYDLQSKICSVPNKESDSSNKDL